MNAPAMKDPINEAILLLTEEADALSDCRTRTPGDWAGEPEAKAHYDHVLAVVDALSKLRAPVAKPKRAPLDDWRVQAIADCLETEWDDMSPDLAESYARTIVGYMIEYEKESDRIEAKHASEPVEPIVQAIRNLRASAPVAGERAAHLQHFCLAFEAFSRASDSGEAYAELERAYEKARAALASAPVVSQQCPTDVCQAAKADGVLCANDECDRASGVRPASAPVAGMQPLEPEFAKVLSDNFESLMVRAPAEGAPVAEEAKPSNQEILALAAKHSARLRTDNMIAFARALLSRYAAPQASPVGQEAVAELIEELSDLTSDMAYEANQEMDQEKASRAALIERGERALRRVAGAAPQASEAARDAGIAASAHQLVAAAKVMTKLYPHVWDRTDGSLVVFPENVAKFDAAFDALRVALGEAVEDDDSAALSAQPGAQKESRDA